MMTPDPNKVYIFNPHYRLRHDLHRVVLFSVSMGEDNGCSKDWHTFIHPLQAAMLSFFTYNRPWRETLPLLCEFFCRSQLEMATWVSKFIDNPHPLCSEWRQGNIYFPKRVLIEAESIKGDLQFDNLDANAFIWKKLDLTTRRLYTGPLLLTLMLTNHCVTRCCYCYADTSTRIISPLSTQRIMELIEEASTLQVQQVNLIGGEVFLHKDWKTILKELVRLHIAPAFISTKMPLTETLLADLHDTGYQGIIQVSLDAYTPQILTETLGGSEQYVEQMLTGLHLLDNSGLNYQVASVLTRHNCYVSVLGELLKRLAELKHLRDWRIVPASYSINRRYEDFLRLKASKKQVIETFKELRLLSSGLSFPVIMGEEVLEKEYRNTWGGSRNFKGSECSALNTHMFILPDGKVTVCEQLYWHSQFIIGDVTGQSLKEVWNSPEAEYLCSLQQKDISPASICKKCSLFTDCYAYQNRCWSNIIKAYGLEQWDFPDPRCIYAPNMKNNLSYDN